MKILLLPAVVGLKVVRYSLLALAWVLETFGAGLNAAANRFSPEVK